MSRVDETARYRQAAWLALDQLDWCVHYLHTIHKTQLADRIAKNRSAIMRRIVQDEDPDEDADSDGQQT
jgi:hypothetical protein